MPVRDHYETYPIHEKGSGSLFKLWLLHRYQQEWHSLPNEGALNTALMTLVASALFNQQERQEVFTRIGYKDGRIYLDLADLDHYVVEIDRNGWRFLQQAPVCFRRYNGIGALPIPKRGGSLALLDPFLNMDANGLLLAKAWAIAGLHPTGPYPVLGLHGEQGAAKTTTARVLRSLIDPCVAFLRPSPKDIQALTIAAANNHIIGLDNLSTLPEWLSDALCRTATGAGDAYRQLYTDRDEVVFSYTKPILFTGIEEVGTRSDLLDRCIIIHLPILPPQCRKTEKDFWEEFGEAHPYILGAILDAVSLALRTYESIDLPEKPRMADFAVWITACQDALFPASASKRSFMDVYMYNRSQAVEIAIEASPVGTAIKKLMHTKDIWTGNAETLLTQIAQVVSEDTRRARSWPRNGRALSSRLKRLATSLRETGIDVIWGRDNKERNITLKKEKQASGGDANGGSVTQSDAKNLRLRHRSIGLPGDGKASGDASDANFLSCLKSKNEKEEREENLKKEKEKSMEKFASLASPPALSGLEEPDEVVTQTQKFASPLRHQDSFASPGIDLSLSLDDEETAENVNS